MGYNAGVNMVCDMNEASVTQAIRREFVKSGETLTGLSKLSGVSPQRLFSFRNGGGLTVRNLEKTAKGLGMKIQVVLCGPEAEESLVS